MADVKLYVDGQMVLPEVGKDMLSMVGWTDSKDIKYCTKVREEADKFVPFDLLLDSDRYIGYFGDEDVTLAISRNRNITLIINTKTVNIKGAENYDYFAKTYYFSGTYTELDLPTIDLYVRRIEEDWMHLIWAYMGIIFEADISLYL